ncbi:MAG: AraC family transcriptional regulator [Chitinophagaceae bacterium]
MKPSLERLPLEQNESFVVKYFDYNFYPTPWHYHPEYELVMVIESTGKRFIGDHISEFKPGNLALLGPNIPHTYRNDEKYYSKKSSLRAKSIVIHFSEASLGNDLLFLPEAKPIRQLLQKSLQGFDIGGQTHTEVSKKLIAIVDQKGLRRWHSLVEILMMLAESKKLKPITSTPQIGYNEKESARLCQVFDWITLNYSSAIKLSDAAKIAGMNENAFSRFFAQRTRKTFSGFVQEMRLQKAARLLVEDEISVTAICYDCGYNNISNFNRQFLNYYNMNPLSYKKTFLKNAKN